MIFIVILAIFAFTAPFQGVFAKKCPVPIKHYEEMGCNPVYNKAEDECPSHFTCEQFKSRSLEKCYYNGIEYNRGDKIDSSLTAKNCLAACFCARESSKVVCAHIDCPEFFGLNRPNPGCYNKYSLDNCCAQGSECPPFDKLAKCEVNGKTYYEGQRFDNPGEDCVSCICQAGFTGKFEEPFCKPVSCGVELIHSENFRDNCAPVYYGNSRCCPIQWNCPSKDDEIIAAKTTVEGEKCKYGEKTLNVGDKIVLKKLYESNPEINCECRIPPHVTCTQKPHES